MHIVTRRHLSESMQRYPEAANEIKAWVSIVAAAGWRSFQEVTSVFTDADHVSGYVVFNIRQNRYRLITVIHYAKDERGIQTQSHIYIRSFITHKQYDKPANWDRKFGTR